MSDRQHFALILAAGFSSRMGTCKSTLPWCNGQTLLRYQAEQFLQAGITPIIVLGSHNVESKIHCPQGSLVIVKPHSDRHKTSSIITGLKSLPTPCATVIISAVDQPRSSLIYQTLIQIYDERQPGIVAPVYGDRSGHPLLFSGSLIPELCQIKEETFGLREIVRRFDSQIERVDLNTPEVLVDLNTQKDYLSQLEIIKNHQQYDG